MSYFKSLLGWTLVIIVLLTLFDASNAWRRRRRRRACATHSCSWYWGGCSKTCGSGVQYPVKSAPQGPCGSCNMPGARSCNTHCCAVNCVISSWSTWSTCSSTCGAVGTQTRTRTITTQAQCGGAACSSDLQESQPCNRVCYNEGKVVGQSCTCPVGFEGECCEKDIDECQTVECISNSRCVNTDGSYSCVCNSGFSHDNGDCIDVDECALELHNCHQDAECVNIHGNYTCACIPGFSGDGKNCTDIDECTLEDLLPDDDGSTSDYAFDNTTNLPNCHDLASCVNTEGSFTCVCTDGYTGDGINCEDIDECGLPIMTEERNSTDENYQVQNYAGYTLESCDVNGYCTNSIGGYDCFCNDGYYGSGWQCLDIDECASSPCKNGGICSNLINSYECFCKTGFIGATCNIDVNECLFGTHDCDATNGVCHNTNGSFTCSCKDGFTGNGQSCNDIDECATGGGAGGAHSSQHEDCDVMATCVNTEGGYQCVCNHGYTGDGFACSESDAGSQYANRK